MICIYKITSPSNKIYIGQTIKYKSRLWYYKVLKCKEQPRLYNSLCKYGYDNHVFEIIEECEESELNIRERFWQDYYDVIGKQGLNCVLTKTTDRSGKMSEETRQKLIKNNIKPMLGKTHSEESKLKMSMSKKGIKLPEEWRDNISKSLIGNTYSKLSKIVLDTQSGIYYDSISKASFALGINYNTLKAWIHKHNLHYTQKETTSTYTVWNKDIKGEDSHSYGRVLDNTAREKISKKLVKELGHTKGGHRSRYSSYWESDFRRTPLLEKFGYKCAKCDCKENLEVDHIKPCFSHPELAFDEDNVQILCKECHREKSIEDAVLSKQTIKFGMLISKDLVGIEDTYDMEIDHKSHNYIANKILVHNSRRYVSGERVPFEFYVSEKMKFISIHKDDESDIHFGSDDFNRICEERYYQALEKGVKPQEARRVIPQSAYTQIWGAFMPNQLDNYFKLRLDKHAQWEIRMVSKAMQELINGRK